MCEYYYKIIKKHVNILPGDNIHKKHKRSSSAVRAQRMYNGLTADTHPYPTLQNIGSTILVLPKVRN